MDTLNSVSWIREIVIKKYGKIGIMDIKLLATWIQKLWGHGNLKKQYHGYTETGNKDTKFSVT